MPSRPRALIGAILLAAALAAPAARGAEAVHVGTFVWNLATDGHGGFSGLELDETGTQFWSISDHGWITEARLERRLGRIVGVDAPHTERLKRLRGQPMNHTDSDAEGLARGADGTLYISFERRARIWSYPDGTGAGLPVPVKTPRAFSGLQRNAGLEALAIDADGALYTLAERSGALDRPFAVYRRSKAGRWSAAFELPRRGVHLPVGADFGPDGKLYLLERHFAGIFGFSTRIRRFEIRDGRLGREETLLTTRAGLHDNLEGIAVWRDRGGAIRLTLISDDNFMRLQRTELVEYRVIE